MVADRARRMDSWRAADDRELARDVLRDNAHQQPAHGNRSSRDRSREPGDDRAVGLASRGADRAWLCGLSCFPLGIPRLSKAPGVNLALDRSALRQAASSTIKASSATYVPSGTFTVAMHPSARAAVLQGCPVAQGRLQHSGPWSGVTSVGATEIHYALVRSRHEPELYCAAPEGRPEPAFVHFDRWLPVGRMDEADATLLSFDRKAARVAVRFNGFYLFVGFDGRRRPDADSADGPPWRGPRKPSPNRTREG